MAIKRYLQGIAILLLLISFIQVSIAAPTITAWDNNKTNNLSTSFTVNVSDSVHFSATANETINMTWHWFLNGTDKSNNASSYNVSFSGNTIVEVNVTNQSTGLTSNKITWTVTVQPPSPPPALSKPYIESWGNTKTNNDSISIVINRTESVTFNATANQTITTWNWYLNGTNKLTNSNSFTSQFNYAGSHNVAVNATNANGTTNNTIVWNINVVDNEPPGNITGLSNTSGYTWISWLWTNPLSDFKLAMVYIDNNFVRNVTTNTYNTSLDFTFIPKTIHNISLQPVDFANNIGNWTNNSATTLTQPPNIIKISPSGLVFDTLGIETKTFEIEMGSQTANVTWTGAKSQSNLSISPGGHVYLIFTPSGKGQNTISVSANNENGTSNVITWNWTVRPTTFSTGNRIWDGSKPDEFALTYNWNPMSFSGFYYNAKDDVGNENIKITLGSYTARTISAGSLVYTTSPQEVSFTYSPFGKYQVIGFMAEKYFAGYKNTTLTNPTSNVNEISAVGQGQLHKVLIDDDTKRTIAVGGTYALQEGYVLKATDIDLNARTMLLSLLKDGTEVDSTPLSANQIYVYRKRVGSVSDLPIIMVRFDTVFSGSELQVAFLKGLFQISENPTIISTGSTFRNMKVGTVSTTGISMENSNAISLSKGSTNDVMGDVKILVANNEDSALRFALSVEKTGTFEIRSTVYRSDITPTVNLWTPYNFGMNIGQTSIGFYYDLDDGIGSETLSLTPIGAVRSIPDQGLTYSTSPVEVKFTYTGFGKYQVIGFMADKYFAGYTTNTLPPKPKISIEAKSSLANGALHKVLIDDDTKKTIAVGGTIALKEGYVLKATDIDLNARVILLSLLKDGSEIDTTPLGTGETYVYSKKVGGTDNLPLIMVRFENVFSGSELQVGFLKGIFQISDTPTIIKATDQFGKMEVRTVSDKEITMSNDGSISLDKNKNDVLMGNIRLKVADTDAATRFYFAVDVTPEMIVNQLVIDAPVKAMAGDTIKIKITAGGVGMNNATVNIGTDSATTDQEGSLNYTLPKTLKGTYSITASMTGYEKATQNIEIEKYVNLRLSIEAPSQSNQFETITIKVLYNGTAMSGAKVNFDNTTVGTSDSNGEVTYKLETSGTHSISASKISYITVTRDIEIREPYSEFKALDINITPNPGFAGKPYLVKANITNVGTKSDSKQIDLVVNGTAVDNKTITLGAKEMVEVNFTRIEPIAGNVTVEIMGQSMLFEAKENPTNYLLIGAIITGIGAVIIYVLTSKGLLSLEILKQKSILLKDAANLQIQKLSMLFKK